MVRAVPSILRRLEVEDDDFVRDVDFLGFDGFCPTGSPAFLFERAGLTPDGIASAAREVSG